MALLGKAILAVWNEVEPADEGDFADWYLREHLPERTSVPGMTRGRKYRALDGGSPANMALYEARTLDVLTAGAYRTQLDNPTEWTRRVTSRFTFMRRAICEVIADAGQGVGGFATVFHFHPAVGAQTQVRAWVQRICSELVNMTLISAAHCWVGAEGEPATPTSDLSARAASNKPVGWVLAIEAADRAALEAAREAVLASDPAKHGVSELQSYPIYQLRYAMASSDRAIG
jgi:hypothetical protein